MPDLDLLTLAEQWSLEEPGRLDWASAGVWVFAAVGVVPLGPPGPGPQVGAAGWWVEPSAAATRSVTAVW